MLESGNKCSECGKKISHGAKTCCDCRDYSWSKESREKRSGKNHWTYGRTISEETRKKIGDASRGRTSPCKGKPWSEARRQADNRRKETFVYSSIKADNGREYPHDWSEIRGMIYERDNWTCQECGSKCVPYGRSETKRVIQCHHIDYDTKNCIEDNLVTLCLSCHFKTNFNQSDWTNYFISKREEAGDGRL